MAIETWIRPYALTAAAHLFAGVALSLGDRLLSRPQADSRRLQLTRKRDALLLIEHLCKLEAGIVAEDADSSPPDPQEIEEACAFVRALAARGELDDVGASAPPLTAPDAGAPPNLWHRFVDWLVHERLNTLSTIAKLKAAFLIELGADLLVAISALTWGRGNWIGAIGHSLYQGPALFLGLVTGSLVFKRRDDRVPRKLRKDVERLQEALADDAAAGALVARILRGEPLALAAPAAQLPGAAPGHPATDDGALTPDASKP